ncbi:hypothetical protein FRB97_000854 [Tulasnella sp. 331]|nr:hypothetical protein FRB97_000854 [Tulasnella sp. 331]
MKNNSSSTRRTWSATSEVSAFSSLHVLPHAIRSLDAPKSTGIRLTSSGRRSLTDESTTTREDLEPLNDDINLTTDDGSEIKTHLEQKIGKIYLGDDNEKKALGKSSGASLIQVALGMKATLLGPGAGIHAGYTSAAGASRRKF